MMGAQGDGRQPGWYELPFWRMVKYVLYGGLTGFLSSYALTRFLNWDIILLDFHLQNWWLFLIEGWAAFCTVYVWNWDRKKGRKQRTQQAQQQLKQLIRDVGGEKKK